MPQRGAEGWTDGIVEGGGAVVGLQDGADAVGGPPEVIGLLGRQVREPGGRAEGRDRRGWACGRLWSDGGCKQRGKGPLANDRCAPLKATIFDTVLAFAFGGDEMAESR